MLDISRYSKLDVVELVQGTQTPQDGNAEDKAFNKKVAKLSDDLYVYQLDDDLCYVMERVSGSRVGEWKAYHSRQCSKLQEVNNYIKTVGMSAARRAEPDYPFTMVKSTRDPLQRFDHCLNYADKDGTECWVAYAVHGAVSKPYEHNPENVKSVEMAMAVLTNPDAKFQLHMGIARGVEFVESKQKMHSGISLDIHGFAAKVMNHVHGNRFIVTTPMDSMRKIFEKKLDDRVCKTECNESNSFVHVKRDKLHYRDIDSFKLCDDNGAAVFNADNKESLEKNAWFFENTQPSIHLE
ncbi:hypothetical protein [Endozoicomonas sp.]|uniref:hypothetical protein n=1 Tax=Endozoicomonas sp. TaxID=1892382 RepID=UPI003AF7E018